MSLSRTRFNRFICETKHFTGNVNVTWRIQVINLSVSSGRTSVRRTSSLLPQSHITSRRYNNIQTRKTSGRVKRSVTKPWSGAQIKRLATVSTLISVGLSRLLRIKTLTPPFKPLSDIVLSVPRAHARCNNIARLLAERNSTSKHPGESGTFLIRRTPWLHCSRMTYTFPEGTFTG